MPTVAPTSPLTHVPQFFMQPSLTTGQGTLQAGSGFSPWASQLLGNRPVATLALRYETPTTLLLRGILRQDDPGHRAILQRFPGEPSVLVAGGMAVADVRYSISFGNRVHWAAKSCPEALAL